MDDRCFFRCVDGVLLRAAAIALPELRWPTVTGEADELAAGWRGWLGEVWAQAEVAAAVKVASPVLAGRVEALLAGRTVEMRLLRRMVLSMVRYLARMAGRATPFGLFAGVAPVELEDEAVVRWGEGHRAVADADALWLTGVITWLECCPPLARRLPVVVNNLCVVRGERLVLPYPAAAHRTGGSAPVEVSVRHTPAVRAVVAATRHPVRYGEVAERLAEAFPGTSERLIEAMLNGLISQGVLVSALRAPTTVPDALGYLLERLDAVRAQDIPLVASVVRSLRVVHGKLRAHDFADSAEVAASLRRSVSETMTAVAAETGSAAGVEQPLKVDLRLDGEISVPAAVAREAERAAWTLVRLTPYPSGTPAWRDFHQRFIDRFGVGALVPLADAIDPAVGVGFPAGYRGSELADRPEALTGRDTRLLVLAQRAAAEGEIEAALDEAAIGELAGDAAAMVEPPAHAEICVEVLARSAQELTRGAFTLLVTAAPRGAGTVSGRFAGLCDPAHEKHRAAALAALPSRDPGAAVVQVSYPPLLARSGNLVRGPAFTEKVISLGEHPQTGQPAAGGELIGLEDLAVGSDGQRLFLASVSGGFRVEPTVFHALEFRANTPPIARFLCEITRATSAVYGIFDWGAAAMLSFLPRLRYRRSILSPARWTLRAQELPDTGAGWPEWDGELTAWRRRFRMPARVQLWDADRRLEVDLDADAHRAVLRAHLDRNGQAILTETPDQAGRGWLDGRAGELVLPLVTTRTAPVAGSAAAIGGPQAPARLVRPGHGYVPGQPPWLFASVYASTPLHDRILRDHLPSLLAAWEKPPSWWFVRYRDQRGPHLRLRIHADDQAAYAHATQAVAAWVTELHRDRLAAGLVFETYYPETGRYGPGAAMRAAEQVFAADSRAVLTQLAARRAGIPAEALTAASLLDIAVAFTGDRAAGLRWLVEHPPPPGALPREAASWAVRLTAPDPVESITAALAPDAPLRAAWRDRTTALAAYRGLAAEAGYGPEGVLPALLHMHHNRAAGVRPEGERICRGLARSAALAWTHRRAEARTR